MSRGMQPAQRCGLLLMFALLATSGRTFAEDSLPEVFTKRVPRTLEDLRRIENHVQELMPQLSNVTVAVQIGPAQGSGVIVSEDGYVLTAAHVAGRPGRRVQLILSDGRRVYGRSLGGNESLDAALLKIDESEISWPFAEIAEVESVDSGDWCIAMGHPGGYQSDRTPVIRLGRVIRADDSLVQTDCELVGGDSGGPLFDMAGRVIGINSRIGPPTSFNFHAPLSSFSGENWDRLANSEWYREHSGAMLGVSGEPHADGLRITKVWENEPADKAGVREGDILVRFQRHRVRSLDQLIELVGSERPGEEVELDVLRDGETLEIEVKLGRASD